MELRESGQETDRQMKEADRRLQETERLLRENSADFDRRMKRSEKDFNRRFGYLDNRFGELAERLVAPNIVKKFNALGYHFDDVGKERKFYRGDGTIAAEFDILLENGGVYCWSGGEAERAGRRGAYRAVGIFEGAEGRVRGQAEDTRGDSGSDNARACAAGGVEGWALCDRAERGHGTDRGAERGAGLVNLSLDAVSVGDIVVVDD
jgi:hypothetical protein